jgi:hypothetical protein
MASGNAGYMTTKVHQPQKHTNWMPTFCAKCGQKSLSLEDDTLVCIYDGWTFYLTRRQTEFLQAEAFWKRLKH